MTSLSLGPDNLRLREGCAVGGFYEVIDSSSNPTDEIKRILEIQQNQCTRILRFEPEKIPGLHLRFQEIEEL